VETLFALTQIGRERLRDLISLETVLTLNEAFCENHRQNCAQDGTRDSWEIIQQCEQVDEAAAELRDEYYRIGKVRQGDAGALCVNEAGDAQCNLWASQGDCNANAGAVSYLCVAFLQKELHKMIASLSCRFPRTCSGGMKREHQCCKPHQ
jgi:hypothetical protein